MRRFGGSLFIVKYTYGLRTAMSVFCGLAHFGAHRFTPLTLLSCVVWVGLLVGGGYFFTGTIERLHRRHQEAREGPPRRRRPGYAIVFVVKHYRLGRRVI